MQQVNTYTESELSSLKDEVESTLLTMRKQLIKKKFKIFGKTMLSVVLVAGGVATAILFPSPITIAVLGCVATLIDGKGGVVRDVRGVKEGDAKRRNGKQELKLLESELVSRKTAREVMSTMAAQNPTAPPMYPNLRY